MRETRYITIKDQDYEVFYHHKYNGGYGGGSNFPEGEPDPQYEIVIDELIDENGKEVDFSNLEGEILRQL